MPDRDEDLEPKGSLADVVDLDLFTTKPVAYRVTDVRGEEHRFRIPQDLPLPAALRFLDSYDAWAKAQHQAMRARHATQQQQARAAFEAAWTELLEGFAGLVQILQPDVTADELNAQYGENLLSGWIVEVAARIDPTRFLQSMQLIAGGDPKARKPKAPSTADESASSD